MTPRCNLYDDPFTFMIEIIGENGQPKERLGGMNNVVAANLAFRELLLHESPGEIIRLRHRGRIMQEATATGGYRERFIGASSPGEDGTA